MNKSTLLPMILVAVSIGACGGGEAAQRRAYQAQEAVAKERLKLVDKYQSCMQNARGDVLAERACETYLSSAEALK